MKYLYQTGLFVIFAFAVLLCSPQQARATSAKVDLSAKNPVVAVGDELTVVCRVSADEVFSDTDFYIRYDPKLLQFISGGDKVTGEKGLLHVSSTQNSQEVSRKTFSLQFKAIKSGNTAVEAASGAIVRNLNEDIFSVSSNQLSILVKTTTVESPAPSVQPEKKSKNTKLSELECSGINGLTPKFDAKVTEYSTIVDCKTDILYFSFQTASKKATAVMKGNTGLKEGNNGAEIVVTAESGAVRTYRIRITKESREQTKQREKVQKKGADGSIFQIASEDGEIVLRNSYEFLVQDVSSLSEIPAGYIATKVQLDGITIPAFTIEKDLDNNYLLLYLKGSSGEPELYQYDREERTLQRYTGDMIAKINKSGQAGYKTAENRGAGKDSASVLYTALAFCVVLILLLLTILLKLLSQNYKYKHGQK